MCLIWLLIIIGHLYLRSGMWYGVAPRMPKKHVLKKDHTQCSQYDTHFKLNIQHDWGEGGLSNHLIDTRIFTLLMNNMLM